MRYVAKTPKYAFIYHEPTKMSKAHVDARVTTSLINTKINS